MEKKAKFPFQREELGRILGPSQGEGNEMAQWVLKANGRVVPCPTVRPLTTAETRKRQTFDALIERRLGDSINPPKEHDSLTPEDEDEINS